MIDDLQPGEECWVKARIDGTVTEGEVRVSFVQADVGYPDRMQWVAVRDIRKSPPSESEIVDDEIGRRFDEHNSSIAAALIMFVTENGTRKPYDGVGKVLVAAKREIREILTVGEIKELR